MDKNLFRAKSATLIAILLFLGGCAQTEKAANTAAQLVACIGEEQPTSRLFLQQVTATSIILKWRGDANKVCAGEDMNRLAMSADAIDSDAHKFAQLTGLKPDTVYF
ncbi:MAG: hypothetical protein AAF512_08200 [Pseudomonadota bacterium]